MAETANEGGCTVSLSGNDKALGTVPEIDRMPEAFYPVVGAKQRLVRRQLAPVRRGPECSALDPFGCYVRPF